ncbi:MAG: hypothetical protein WC375_00340 [Methanomassiliicoccales archaeon]|jgi:DNA-directed RNA polymerase subunit M/transcription elongation factor TFIIS
MFRSKKGKKGKLGKVKTSKEAIVTDEMKESEESQEPSLTKNGKCRGRPPSKLPRTAKRIEEREEEFYKPPAEKRPAKVGEFIGYCCKCNSIIISNDKEGHKYRCTECGRLRLKSELCSSRKSRYSGRREKDEEVESDHQDHMTALPIKRSHTLNDDDENSHNKMVK